MAPSLTNTCAKLPVIHIVVVHIYLAVGGVVSAKVIFGLSAMAAICTRSWRNERSNASYWCKFRQDKNKARI
jgi:uncharacterized membrane protein